MTRWNKNHFWEQEFAFRKKTLKVTHKGLFINEDTGEQSKAQFASELSSDAEPFVKVFKTMIPILADMSSIGIKVFGYMILNMGKNRDMVILRPKDIMTDCKLSSTQYVYKGIQELKELGVIHASVVPCTYFINPKLVYSGDRIETYRNYATGSKGTIGSWEDWRVKNVSEKEAVAFKKGKDAIIAQQSVYKEEQDWEKATDELQELGNLFKSGN